MDRPVALAAAKTDGETSPNVAGSSRGYFELLPDEGTDGGGGSRQRQHQSSAPPWPRLSRHELSAAEGATLGRHKDRIRRFSESRVVCALLHIVVQNRNSFPRLQSGTIESSVASKQATCCNQAISLIDLGECRDLSPISV